MSHKSAIVSIVGFGVLLIARMFAGLDGSYSVPLDDPAIRYADTPVTDPVSRLQERLRSGEARLDYDNRFGYLPAVLKNLGAPVSSQVLVFSKTSFQAYRISPSNPRALFFNDRVSVGWVKDGDVVEMMAVDPQQGAIFYTLDQMRSSSPQIMRRDNDCLQCHILGTGVGVPGWMVRSVHPDSSGKPIAPMGSFLTDHRSPLKERWGGWYVTGNHGDQQHKGNITYSAADDAFAGSNLTDLSRRFDTGAYLSPHSDIVALMVLEHQGRMLNLITRVNYEARLAMQSQAGLNELNLKLNLPVEEFSPSNERRINNAAEALVTYLLFADEAPLDEPLRGSSAFAAEFAKQGPKDRRGRSLRQFDLKRRLFQYPCSYLIYTEAFDKLPDPVRNRIYSRMWEILTGRDNSEAFRKLSSADRQSILEILLETKHGLPAYWQSRT